ncbi:ABC transporter permease [Nonomuraea longicatena]|uniref:ABC transporter permease n=1 Tax=Nonomuraea longicatena TaxID=83682 RepID=A0ABP3ZYM9_9ACTN
MKILSALSRLWLVPVVLVVWETTTWLMDDQYFPRPTEIVAAMYEAWFTGPAGSMFLTERALENVPDSIVRLLAGWALASVLGVALGVAMGRSPLLFRLIDPLIQFGRALPPTALLPLFMALFSTGTSMHVLLIAFGVIWPILFNTADGVRSVDPLHLETGRTFALTRTQRMTRIILPSAMPRIFAGLRLSLSLALILMVISEIFSVNGIGFLLRDAQQSFELPTVWGAIVLLGLLGFILNWLFLLVERRALSWHRAATRTA